VEETDFLLKHCLKWIHFWKFIKGLQVGHQFQEQGTERRIRKRMATESVTGLALAAKIKY
jgi:hypothetical protein